MTRNTLQQRPCPNQAAHALAPDGYVARQNWAAEMSKTHRQTECPGCHRLVIWKLKGGVKP